MQIFKPLSLIILILVIVSGCTSNKATTVDYTPDEIEAESNKANEFFERVFNERVDRHPEFQTYLGIKKDYGKWDDRTEAAAQRELEITKKNLEELKKIIEYEALDEETRISYDLFVREAEKDINNYKWRYHNLPVNQMFGFHSSIPSFLINIHSVDSVADAEAYISRLNGIANVIEQELEGLKKREEMGIIPPQFTFPLVINDIDNILSGFPFEANKEENAIYADFKSKVNKLENVDLVIKEDLGKQAQDALLTSVKTGFSALKEYLQGLQAKAPVQYGAWKLPDGEDYYKVALKNFTTTNMTAEEIHQVGLDEVARIHREMKEIMKEVGFEGSLQDFFTYMKEDEQFYYPNTPEGKEAYRVEAVAIIDNMRAKLDDLFLTKPKADIVVKPVEAFREKSAGGAFYQSPALDGSRPGIYYINLYDMGNQPKYQMESLAYHEGIPGHHMQLSIAQELTGIPTFRKFAKNTAYVEGWALYSENIPTEMGFYQDPFSDFGRLANEVFRAARLVVDTGIHSKKWTREQAIAYMNENTPNPADDNRKEIERYIVWPGQATGYKIGMLKIQELREKAMNELGESFDIREFHDQILTHGPLPLDMLEDVVESWIVQKKS